MNRRIAAWTIAAVAVLGLTACSSSPSASDDTKSDDTASSQPAEETSTDQSVADACAAVNSQVAAASGALSGLDVSGAMDDPQATIDAFTETTEAIGAAAESVSNQEVKDATTAVYEDFAALGGLLSKVLIDQDMSVAAEVSTVSADVQESATALSTLCAG